MIFYFTGTGNSGYVATQIAKENNEELISISKLMNENKKLEFTLYENEIIGFVYPVYAWGPPKMVLDFIDKCKFNNYNNNYIFSVTTCGQNIGDATNLIKKKLNKKEMTLNSGFSIVMPNNYIIFGDVDSKEVEKEKLDNTEKEIIKINKCINQKQDKFDEHTGSMAKLLTALNPAFNKYAINVSKFYSTDDCISCGKCEKVCTSNVITMVDDRPKWNGDCSQCLACINHCPKNAIQYSKSTANKGRYVNPYFKW